MTSQRSGSEAAPKRLKSGCLRSTVSLGHPYITNQSAAQKPSRSGNEARAQSSFWKNRADDPHCKPQEQDCQRNFDEHE